MRAGRITRAALIGALACACAAGGWEKGPDVMYGTLLKLVPDSNAIADVRLGQSTKTKVQGAAMLRVSAEVLESFRGPKGTGEKIELIVPDRVANDYVAPGKEVIVLLKAEGGAYKLTEYSEPISVPVEGREAFLKAMRETVRAGQPMAGAAARRQHVLGMLQSGIDFFVEDAARSAADTKGFTDPELDVLLALVKGDDKRPPAQAMIRENLIMAIFASATPAKALSMRGEPALRGAHREIYYGVVERDPKEVETIVRGYLADPDEKVQADGLLVAGLLRRQDILDAFAAGLKRPVPPAIQAALKQAREFVTREF